MYALVGEVDAAIAARVDTAGDSFAMTVDGVRVDKRSEAADRLHTVLAAMLDDPLVRDGRPIAGSGDEGICRR